MGGNGRSSGRILVLGGGIVGVATAVQLQRAGWETTLVERDAPGTGTSFGNAGIIAGDAVAPIASPGILWQVPGFLMDADAPLAVRWSYLPTLAPWLYRFVRAGRTAIYQRNARIMTAMVGRAWDAYAPLVKAANAEDLIRETSTLQVYETQSALEAARADVTFKRSLGGRYDEIGAHEVRQYAPRLAPVVGGMVRHDLAFVRDPLSLTQALHRLYEREGGRTVRLDVQRLERAADGAWRLIGTADGQEADVATPMLVIAAGSWSARLLRTIGLRVLLDTERGYHIMLPNDDGGFNRPVLFAEGAFYGTPMMHGLRLAGTVEMGGLDRQPDPRRPEAIRRRARRLIADLDETGARTWMGYRPSMPDSLPVIDKPASHPGLLLAFGHAHLGLTMAAITGRLVTQIAAGERPEIDITPFRADRF
ncbi:NAD(P)/FAD-dependent oxidoreductase [Marinivivus vitaminiproducens]|uniref:NAD(P)/FAD-dependent oxidoreductase n=1 Tax=Marinivivus vitaminiproducens TaxID=3035935 RepID=UPI0027AAE9E7|nr:FAD-dependent oxidoreductase [Geminicoccaceae bacterium SCSIO 64248]